jgi:hypothetical protein
MENSSMLIMFIFSGICFIGGLVAGYSIWGSNINQENAGQD